MSENHVTGNTARDAAIQINGDIQGSVNFAKHDLQPSFFKTSNYESYKNVNPERVQQTCRWFLEHLKFQRWNTSNQNDILWLSADPGCGKSVLSRALVDEMLVGDKSPVTICYFFFKDNEEQNNVCTAICALLHQILCARNGDEVLKKHILPAHRKSGEALKGDFEELWRTFISAATDSRTGSVICILDALDECKENDRTKLIRHLEDYYNRPSEASNLQQSWLKFFVTSRPYGNIEQEFSELTHNMPAIRLAGEEESEPISQEIGVVLEARVTEIARRCKLSDQIRSSLHSRLCEIPNRTYLWLHLTLSEVEKMTRKGGTEKRLLATINNLPNSVENAYEAILAGCDREETTKILQIIVAAQRPLTILEIDVALEVESNSTCYADLNRLHKDRGASIRESCGLFVSIIKSRVFLIHQTAKEFLIRKQTDNSPSESPRWKYSIDLHEAHRLLSQRCVAYLLFPETQQLPSKPHELRPNLSQFKEEHDFLYYSANYWVSHVQEAGSDNTDWISRTVKLCDIRNSSSGAWFKMYDRHPLFIPIHKLHTRSALWYAVKFGLINETKFLLESGLRCDDQQDDLQSVFIQAVKDERYGEQLIAIFIEQRGAEIEITDDILCSVAANRGCGKDIITLLLEQRGAEIEITDDILCSAAANRGCGKDIITLLLEQRGAEIEITDNILCSAAANRGCGKEIMAFLLEQRGAEIKVTEGILYRVVLNEGCGKEIMTLLLEQRGDEVKVTQDMIYFAALHNPQGKEIIWVILNRMTDRFDDFTRVLVTIAKDFDGDIMGFLLDRENGMVKITEEVLEAAAGNENHGHQIVELLLDRSDRVKITEKVLEAAAKNKQCGHSLMKLLLRQNDNAKITERALINVARNRNGSGIMKLLLQERKEEVEVTQEVVDSLVVRGECAGPIMKLLLDHGGDDVRIFEQKAVGRDNELMARVECMMWI